MTGPAAPAAGGVATNGILVAHRCCHSRCASLKRNVRSRDFGEPFEEVLGHDVRGAACAGGPELRRRRARIVDEFLQRLGSARWCGNHLRRSRGNRYGFEIIRRITALRVKRFINWQRRCCAKNCIPIRLRCGDAAMREIAGGAGAIFNNNSLTELALQFLSNEPGDYIDESTRRKADDDGDGLRGISVCARRRHSRLTYGSSQCNEQIRAPRKARLFGIRWVKGHGEVSE